MRELCQLQDEFEVAYARIVVVSVDSPEVQSAFRAGLGARFTFLSDAERRWLDRAAAPRGHRHAPRSLPAGRVHPLPGPDHPPRLQRLLVLGPGDDGGAAAGHAGDHDGASATTGRCLTDEPRAAVRLRQVRRRAASAPDPQGPGRRLRIDARCLARRRPSRAPSRTSARSRIATPRFASTSPRSSRLAGTRSPGGSALLGDDLVCLSTFALDASRCAGAVTVARTAGRFGEDPFARLFPGTVVEADFFCAVSPPSGPVIERYAGAPWPGGSFGSA